MSMPSYWYDPMVSSGGVLGGNAATGQPAMSSAQINASMGWNPNAAQFDPWANTPGGFGAQTAAYQQAAANNYGAINTATLYGGGSAEEQYEEYIRSLGGGGGGIGSDAARVPAAVPQLPAYIPSPYDHPYSLGDSSWYPTERTPYSGGGIGSDYGRSASEQWQQLYGGGSGGGIGSDALRDQFAWTLAGSSPYATPGAPSNGPYPNLGYNPGMSNWFANPGMNANQFQNRFGMGFPNAGTPSQHAPGAQMPPGFSQPYSVDNPNGALPLTGPGVYQNSPFGW